MSEKEIIEQLEKQFSTQLEEKVQLTKWSQLLFSDIDEALDRHFDEFGNISPATNNDDSSV